MGFDPSQGSHPHQVPFPEDVDPVAVGDVGWLYTKDVAAVTELFYLDSTGAAVQLTSGGSVNGGAVSGVFHQGGDSFGALAVLGTNDAFDLAFERDSGGAGGEIMRLVANGLLIGRTITTLSGTERGFGIEATGDNVSMSALSHANGAAFRCLLSMGKTRGTAAVPTAVVDGDNLAEISLSGGDGVGVARAAAQLLVQADGSPPGGGGSTPGRILLGTTSSGDATPTERLRIDSQGRTLLESGRVLGGISFPTTGLIFGRTADEVAVDIAGVEHFRFKDSALLIGKASAPTGAGQARVELESDVLSLFLLDTFANPAGQGNELVFRRARGTEAARLPVLSGDAILSYTGQGTTTSGAVFALATRYLMSVDGAPTAAGCPGRLTWETSDGTGPTTTERMRLDSSGTARWTPNGSTVIQEVGTTGRLTRSTVTVTPATLTADANDYDPGDAEFFRVSSDASRTVTGLAPTGGNLAGRTVWLANVGANDVVLANQSASSAAANRIITGTGANVTLAADDTAILVYDATTSRWRLIA